MPNRWADAIFVDWTELFKWRAYNSINSNKSIDKANAALWIMGSLHHRCIGWRFLAIDSDRLPLCFLLFFSSFLFFSLFFSLSLSLSLSFSPCVCVCVCALFFSILFRWIVLVLLSSALYPVPCIWRGNGINNNVRKDAHKSTGPPMRMAAIKFSYEVHQRSRSELKTHSAIHNRSLEWQTPRPSHWLRTPQSR